MFQKSDSKGKLQGRTAVADTKFENLQWSFFDSISESSADTDICIQKRMGCSMSREKNRWQWSKEEQLLHTVKLALLAFNKQKSLIAVHFLIDDTTALLYLVKIGGTRNH